MSLLQAFFMVGGYLLAVYFMCFHKSETEKHQAQDIERLNEALKRVRGGAEYDTEFFKRFCEGAEAATKGTERGNNPHHVMELAHDGWDAGWRAESYHRLYCELHSLPAASEGPHE